MHLQEKTVPGLHQKFPSSNCHPLCYQGTAKPLLSLLTREIYRREQPLKWDVQHHPPLCSNTILRFMRNLTTYFFPSILPLSLPQLPPLERGSSTVTAVCSNASLAVPLRPQKRRAKLHLPLRSALTRTLLSLK